LNSVDGITYHIQVCPTLPTIFGVSSQQFAVDMQLYLSGSSRDLTKLGIDTYITGFRRVVAHTGLRSERIRILKRIFFRHKKDFVL